MRLDYKEHSILASDKLGVHMEIKMQYAYSQSGDMSIEGYELEGQEVDREDLLERFSIHAVTRLEGLDD